MENYKKISLLLLLSTTFASNATGFNPYDTSGNPDFGDFDDQSGDFLPASHSRDYRTDLEKEFEKQQKPVTKKPTSQPIPVPQPAKKDPNPYKQHEAEKNERTANLLANEFTNICAKIEKRDNVIKIEKGIEADYTNALQDITEKRALGRYEKFFIGVAVVAGAAAVITEEAKNVPGYAIIAIGSTIGTAWSYISRRRSCNREEQTINATHQIELEKVDAATRSFESTKTREELIKEAEAKLAQLKTVSLPSQGQDTIRALEAILNRLRA